MQISKLMKGEDLEAIKNGPCSTALESMLQSLRVQRQAYHGKSFVGNHVHKLLQVKDTPNH